MEWKKYNEYIEVSNSGLVRNAKSKKILKLQWQNGSVGVRYRENGKHKGVRVAQAIWRLFVDENFYGFLYHKDGNKYNCALDNLIPAIKQRCEQWQIDEFEKWAYPTAKYYLKKSGYIDLLNIENQNDYIQDAVILMWKYLSNLKQEIKFSTWGKRYCRFAFLQIYKQVNLRKRYIISLENLRGEEWQLKSNLKRKIK